MTHGAKKGFSILLLVIAASAFFAVSLAVVSMVKFRSPRTVLSLVQIEIILAIATGALIAAMKLWDDWAPTLSITLFLFGLGSTQTRVTTVTLGNQIVDSRSFVATGVLLMATAAAVYVLARLRFSVAEEASKDFNGATAKNRRQPRRSRSSMLILVGVGSAIIAGAYKRGLTFGFGAAEVTLAVVVIAAVILAGGSTDDRPH